MKTIKFKALSIMLSVIMAASSAYSQSVMNMESLNKLNDFVVTFTADPSDINKDGYVDEKDSKAARNGYDIAIRYSDMIPDNIAKKLDWNKDGKVSAADLECVTKNISRVIALNNRVNNPVMNFVSVSDVNYVFVGAPIQEINDNRPEKFESPEDNDLFRAPIADKKEAATNKYLTKETVHDPDNQVKFCNMEAVEESANCVDFKVGASSYGELINVRKWLMEYGSDIVRNGNSQNSFDNARVSGMKGALSMNDLDRKFTAVMDFVGKSVKFQHFTLKTWGIGKDGDVHFVFSSGADPVNIKVGTYTTLEIIVTGDTSIGKPGDPNGRPNPPAPGSIMEIKRVLKTYQNDGKLISCVSSGDKYDNKTKKRVESYVSVATDIDSSGVVRKEAVAGSVFNLGGDKVASYSATNEYSSSGKLTASIYDVSLYDSGPDTIGNIHVEYSMNDTGTVTYTHVYNEQGVEILYLSGSGKKELNAIASSYRPTPVPEPAVPDTIVKNSDKKEVPPKAAAENNEDQYQAALEVAPENNVTQDKPVQSDSEFFQRMAIQQHVVDSMNNPLFSSAMAEEPDTSALAEQLLKKP